MPEREEIEQQINQLLEEGQRDLEKAKADIRKSDGLSEIKQKGGDRE